MVLANVCSWNIGVLYPRCATEAALGTHARFENFLGYLVAALWVRGLRKHHFGACSVQAQLNVYTV